MAVKILLDPQPYHLAVGAGVVLYAAEAPRPGDFIRVDNQLDPQGKSVSGLVKYIVHHVSTDPDDTYIVVTFEPEEE